MHVTPSPRRARRRGPLRGTLALLLAACATGGGRSGAAREPVIIVVNNDLLPSSAVSVWMVPESSGPVLIGSVGPGQVDELSYRPRTNVFNYRLRARLTGNREIISNTFSLAGAARVRWDLQANLAVVAEDRD